MATITYTGNSIPSSKVISLIPPVGISFAGREIKVGLGPKLFTFSGFTPADIVATWNGSDDALISEITAEEDGLNVVFTHTETNRDFHLTCLVDGTAGLASSIYQALFGNGPTGGTYTLNFNGQVTGAITYVPGNMATSAANALAALEALSNLAPGDVVVTSPQPGVLRFAFGGAYLGQQVSFAVGSAAGLTGGTGTITPVTIQQGSAGANAAQTVIFDVTGTVVSTNEQQKVRLTNAPTAGTITYTFNAETSGTPLAYNHTDAQLQTNLVALPTPVAGDITAVGDLSAGILVNFQQAYAGTNVPQLTYTSVGQNTQQTITFSGASSGNFKAIFRGATTGLLAWNVSTANLQIALRALVTINGANVTVTGSPGAWVVTFDGAFANSDILDLLQIDASALVGIQTGVVSETTKGVAGTNETQLLMLTNSPSNVMESFDLQRTGTISSGAYKFTSSAIDSVILNWNDNAGKIAEALSTMFYNSNNLYGLNCIVPSSDPTAVPSATTPISFKAFGGAGGINLSAITITVTSAFGGGGSLAIGNIVNGSGTVTPTYTAGLSFPVSYGADTKTFSLSDDIATVQGKIESFIGIGAGNVLVTEYDGGNQTPGGLGPSWGLWRVQFINNLAGTPVSLLTPGAVTGSPFYVVSCARAFTGVAGTNERQTLTSTATSGNFTLAYLGIKSVLLNWNDTAATIQTAIRAIHINLAATVCGGGPLNTTPVTIDFSGVLKYTDVPLLVFDSTNIGVSVTKNQTGSVAPILEITTIRNGVAPATIYNTVGDSYNMRVSVSNDPTRVYLITNIPYNVSAANLTILINNVMGASAVACTGGPHPVTLITITFGGAFANTVMNPIEIFPSFTPTVLRAGSGPTRTDNSFELTIIPDEGTLGMVPADNDHKTWFYLNITTDEAAETNNQVMVNFYHLNAERIEAAINEHFGRRVCSVTRIAHSQEWAPVRTITGAYSTTTKKYYCWYYRGVYRITFMNEFAAPSTVTSMTLTMPTKVDGVTPVDPYDFMAVEADTSLSADETDFRTESRRIAKCFQAATSAGAPIHLFSLSRMGTATPSELRFRYQIQTQFSQSGATINLPRVGIADFPPDMKVRWQWGYVEQSDLTTDTTVEEFTPIVQSNLLDWDSSAEAHLAALENMLQASMMTSAPGFFGQGNVSITGSLYGSWLPDPYGPGTSAVSGFSSLQVTLIGALARLPLQQYDYRLKLVLESPYSWQADGDADYIFKKPHLASEVMYKPVEPLTNERQRFDVVTALADVTIATILVGYGTAIIEVEKDIPVGELQDTLNELSSLGTFGSDIADNTITDSTQDPPAVTANSTPILPVKNSRAVTLYGTTPVDDPFEVEFSGHGFSALDVQNLVFMGGDAKEIVTVTNTGSPQRPEIQSLTMTPGVFGGTFTLNVGANTSAAQNWNLSNATLDSVLEGLASVGAGGVTSVTGAASLSAGTVLITFAQALNNVPQIVIVPSLNNGTLTVTNTQVGGLGGTIGIVETVRGGGAAYFCNAENFDLNRVPTSQDTVLFDDATQPVLYGIEQVADFTVIDSAGTLLYTGRRSVFVDGQKVWISSSNTLPSGFAAGYYFVVGTTTSGTFKLATVSGGSAVVPVGNGVGIHTAKLKDIELLVMSRYAGGQLGLPNRRSSGDEEYLPRYLKMAYLNIDIGIEDGDSLSLARIDATPSTPVIGTHLTVRVRDTNTSSVNGVPAVLFLTGSQYVDYQQDDGDCGFSFYTDETSIVGPINIQDGSLVVNNCTINGNVTRGPNAEFLAMGDTTSTGTLNE